MGKPVTIDSDDVEALLNAAVFGREAERMLKTLKSDPAMMRLEAKGSIESAMQRVNRARADAIRPEELKLPALREIVLTEYDRNALKLLRTPDPMGVQTTDPESFGLLCRLGLAVRGQCNEVVRWSDGSDPAAQSLPYHRVRITDRGRQWLELGR